MSISTSGGIDDVGFGVRCCLSVNIDEWIEYWFCCKMLFECQIRQLELLEILVLM